MRVDAVTEPAPNPVLAMFATHWRPAAHNQVSVVCHYCGRNLGKYLAYAGVPEWWRPYTRVVVTERTPDRLVTDISHWCPECWPTRGQAAKQQQFPGAQFQEVQEVI